MFEALLAVELSKARVAGTWVKLVYPHAFGLQDASLVRVEDYLYLFGGMFSNGDYNNTMWRYDTVNNTWVRLADGLEGRTFMASAAVGGKIYYFTGRRYAGYISSNVCYDIATNTWTTLTAAYPKANISEAPRAVTIADKIYIYGGQSGFAIGNTYVFDPATGLFTALAARTPGIYADAAFSLDGLNIVSAWGQDSTNVASDKVFVYNLATNKWTAGNPATAAIPNQGVKGTVYKGIAFCFGGAITAYSNKILTYDGVGWTLVTQSGVLPPGRNGHGWVAGADAIYMLSGRGAANYPDFWKFIPD